MKKRKNIVISFILICVLQLLLSLFWAEKKSYLFMDELFSYASANRAEGTAAELPSGEWLDEKWLEEYMSADSEHRFEYSIPYRNQSTDVHPPLFYLFLHTACSFVPEKVSYLAGISFNILFFAASTFGLYALGKILFRDKICGLLTAFLYSVSYGGLNTMVFIRMYMLLTLIVILHVYGYLNYMEREKPPLKGYLFLGGTFVAGVLTQYYFAIIAFFLGIWYTVRFIYKKQYRKLIAYIATVLASAGVSLMIYPTMLHHVFRTGRGIEARENFSSSAGYLEKLEIMWKLLDSQLFFNLFFIVLAGLIVLLVLYTRKYGKVWQGYPVKMGGILFACAGYFMVVTKIAPYQIDRYLMPIYPLVYLLIIGSFYKLFLKVWSKKTSIVVCVAAFGGLSALHMLYSAIPHTYSEDIVITPRLEIAENYQDQYVLYFGKREEDIPKYYDILQVLGKYRGYYYVDNLTESEKVSDDIEMLQNENSFVVYVDENMKMQEVSAYLEKIFPDAVLDETCLIHQDENWDVYLIENQPVKNYEETAERQMDASVQMTVCGTIP